MSVIAPTGNTREEDYAVWYQALSRRMQEESWQIVLIFEASTEKLIGYFQYSLSGEVFMMEEVQIALPYQGKYGLFRSLFAFVLPKMEPNIAFVEAYVNRNNVKSMAILERMGLQKIGCNKNGNSFHYRGSFSDLLRWFSGR